MLYFQMVENRATFAEEQQQELIDKLRDSVHEKDKTIKVLSVYAMLCIGEI